MQLVAQIRRVRRLVPAGQGAASWSLTITTMIRANRCARGTTGPTSTGSSPNWSPTPRRSWPPLDGVELDDVQTEAVGLLALVAGQDVEPGDTDGTWRIAPVTRPDRIVSVHDPESRHVHKTNHNYRDGFKAHLGVEPDSGLITACELTAGNVGDAQAAPGLLADETAPVEVLADSAYGSGEFRHHLAEHGHTATIKPIPLHTAIPDGFITDDFTIDLATMTATCPNGITVTISARSRQARFGRHCDGCPLRHRCTRSAKGKILTVHRHHDLLAAARAHAHTPHSSSPTGSTARWSNDPSPGSPAAAAAKSATAASPATASGSPTAAPPSTYDASSTSASTGTTDGNWPTEPAGPGLTKRERHLRRSAIQPRPTSPPTSLFGRSSPRTDEQRHDHHPPGEGATCSAVSMRAAGSTAASWCRAPWRWVRA